MINAMKYFRYFVFVALSSQSFFAVAMETAIKYPQPFPQSHLASALYLGKSAPTPINLKFMSPLLERFSQIDLSHYRSFVVERIADMPEVVMNNPKTSAAVCALFLSVVVHQGSKMLSQARRDSIKKFFFSGVQGFADKHSVAAKALFEKLHPFLQASLRLFYKLTLGYAMENPSYAQLSIGSIIAGQLLGHPGIGGAVGATIYLISRNDGRFDEIAAQNEVTHKMIEATEKKVDAVHQKIVDIDKTIFLNHEESKQSFLDAKKNLDQLKQAMKKDLDVLGENVTEDIQKATKRVTDKIEASELVWKEELNTKLEYFSQQLTTKMDESNATTKQEIKEALENHLQIFSDELQKEIAKLEKGDQDRADAIQKDLNTLTCLVTKHDLANGVMLQQIDNVSSSLKELKLQVVEINTQAKEYQEAARLTIGKILGQTENMEAVIGLLGEQAKRIETKVERIEINSDQQNQNTIILTTLVSGLGLKLSEVEDSINVQLKSLVGDIEELKRNQAETTSKLKEIKADQIEMKSEQAKHGEGIKNISSIVLETKTNMHEQNCLLLKMLTEEREERKASEERFSMQLRESDEARKKDAEELKGLMAQSNKTNANEFRLLNENGNKIQNGIFNEFNQIKNMMTQHTQNGQIGDVNPHTYQQEYPMLPIGYAPEIDLNNLQKQKKQTITRAINNQ